MGSRNHRNSACHTAIALLALVFCGLDAPGVTAQPAAPVILHTSTEQIPLKAYAEMMRAGILQLVSGSQRDIPTVSDVSFFRCSLTGWSPKGVLVASEELFKSEYAERRLLPVFIRPLAVSTVAARAADLESPERIAELRKAVKVPEGGDRSYFFLILSSGDITRYYPFRIATPPRF
ncbi:MAG TPA: hypothetical protein VEA16_13580 [Vicinamibacterales bacterium]|nr:hypothetical protein [Vicinamibacterales bacterium]